MLHPREQGWHRPLPCCQQSLQPWMCRYVAQQSLQGIILCAKGEAGPLLKLQLAPSTHVWAVAAWLRPQPRCPVWEPCLCVYV